MKDSGSSSGVVTGSSTGRPAGADAAAQVRGMVRRARTAALATLDRAGGHPYASLVIVATAADGAPLLLLSGLARHTRNLAADPRASLLVDDTGGSADPLTGGRATLLGRIVVERDPAARRRFLARHPEAAGYADFADFCFYRLDVETAHFIGGFGRIEEVAGADLATAVAGADALLAAEADILAHMNADHADAVALIAERLAGAPAGAPAGTPAGTWRMTGIDPEGIDLTDGMRTLRLAFPAAIATPGDARRALAHLAAAARGASRPAREGLT